jgi:hypothetical protein
MPCREVSYIKSKRGFDRKFALSPRSFDHVLDWDEFAVRRIRSNSSSRVWRSVDILDLLLCNRSVDDPSPRMEP